MGCQQPGRKPALRIEELEERIAPVGVVTAVMSHGGALTITGDAADNQITLDMAGLWQGQVRITGGGGTLVNGQAAVVLDGFNGGIAARFGDGNDAFAMHDIATVGAVTVDGGAGGNAVVFDGVTMDGNLTVKNGSGGDVFTFANGSLSGKLSINDGTGASTVVVAAAGVHGPVALKNGLGIANVTLHDAVIDGAVTIAHRQGGGAIVVDASAMSSIKATVGDGGGNFDFAKIGRASCRERV